MPDAELRVLLDRRVERPISEPVDSQTVATWCETFGWDRPPGDVRIPALVYPVFLRPATPPERAAETGVVLHDELKSALGFPVAIAIGYEIELLGEVRVADRLCPVERIGVLGDERVTRFGPGREWVIEISTTTVEGHDVGVERFRMLGYRPGDGVGGTSRSHAVPNESTWSETRSIDAENIRHLARAARVWAGAHHDTDAARAAGLDDIILDTSSQVALLTAAARRHRRDGEPTQVSLTMRRPVLPASNLVIGGIDRGLQTTVRASVDGRETSSAVITFGG